LLLSRADLKVGPYDRSRADLKVGPYVEPRLATEVTKAASAGERSNRCAL